MKVVFLTNYVHHHQTPIADEFYRLLGDDYKYIACEALPDWLINGGYDPNVTREYILRAYESQEKMRKALQLANEADVVIIGSAPELFVTKRIKEGKLTFRYSERWFKNRPWWTSGIRAWINYYRYHISYRNKPVYMLAASAFTCRDVNAIGAYKNKVFKWGYFTRVDDFALETSKVPDVSSVESTPHIMWCARFLRLKHPELPVLLADRLKKRGYRFHLDMFGHGEEQESTIKLAEKLGVNDVVSFCGVLPNENILKEMRKHDIFLFTSDKNEGWGAVLNESMSNGCAVVASNLIGAAPFLIENGKNGLLFESGNLDSLEHQTRLLLDDKHYCMQLAESAINTMRNVWSPKNAARQFLTLVEALQCGNMDLIPKNGPCSRAERI